MARHWLRRVFMWCSELPEVDRHGALNTGTTAIRNINHCFSVHRQQHRNQYGRPDICCVCDSRGRKASLVRNRFNGMYSCRSLFAPTTAPAARAAPMERESCAGEILSILGSTALGFG